MIRKEEPEPNPVYIGGYNTNLCFPKATPTGYGIGDVSNDFTLMDQHGEQSLYLTSAEIQF